jgi:hypothetical protein
VTHHFDSAPHLKRAIDLLPELANALDGDTSALFQRLYRVSRSAGHMVVPASFRPWVEHSFGSVEAAESQTIVKIANLVTMESALFNPLRASRPVEVTPGDLHRIIEESRGDSFCHPEENTPEDVFGRVRGRHSVTASNLAKYSQFHGLVIFDEHDPLLLSEDRVRDYLEVGHSWAQEVLRTDPAAMYYLFAWNAIWKSGASLIHGHAQVSCTRDMHYPQVERLRRLAIGYREQFGGDYFEDLLRVHEALGLALRHEGVAVIAHLTPLREKEVLILGEKPAELMAGAAYRVLDCLISSLEVTSFNLVAYMPPLVETDEDWSHFPCMIRIVDRGDPMKRTNDVGAIELFASSVVSTDPFRLIDALRERFGRP